MMSCAWSVVLARVLQRGGFVVETTSNGRHTPAALQTPRYDIILCDLRMSEHYGCVFWLGQNTRGRSR